MVQTFVSKSALNEAIALIHAGQIDKAEEICRAGVVRNPDDVNMVAMLGEGQQADQAFEKSFELNPKRKSLALIEVLEPVLPRYQKYETINLDRSLQ